MSGGGDPMRDKPGLSEDRLPMAIHEVIMVDPPWHHVAFLIQHSQRRHKDYHRFSCWSPSGWSLIPSLWLPLGYPKPNLHQFGTYPWKTFFPPATNLTVSSMSAPAEAATASCGRELLAHGILGEPSPVQRQRGCLSDWRSARCASDWRRGWKMYLHNLA